MIELPVFGGKRKEAPQAERGAGEERKSERGDGQKTPWAMTRKTMERERFIFGCRRSLQNLETVHVLACPCPTTSSFLMTPLPDLVVVALDGSPPSHIPSSYRRLDRLFPHFSDISPPCVLRDEWAFPALFTGDPNHPPIYRWSTKTAIRVGWIGRVFEQGVILDQVGEVLL
jgi:hypothetical protein